MFYSQISLLIKKVESIASLHGSLYFVDSAVLVNTVFQTSVFCGEIIITVYILFASKLKFHLIEKKNMVGYLYCHEDDLQQFLRLVQEKENHCRHNRSGFKFRLVYIVLKILFPNISARPVDH